MSFRSDLRTVRVLMIAGALLAGSVRAAERSYPIDCLPDRVVAWNPSADTLFGAPFVPGILLGPPGNSFEFEGSFSVASLGFGGSVIVSFGDIVIEDRPGPDFIVFENAFFNFPIPMLPTDEFGIFAEPGTVEVSADGVQWVMFPYDAQALADTAGTNLDRAGYLSLTGLAGLTPTFTGNWTLPNDPGTWDPTGTGGISGAGGDAFDLATVGLAQARFVRITDANTHNGFPGSAEGFDLDAVVVLHGHPVAPLTPDFDGDRLSDAEETSVYGSNPALADSDNDGIDDGREVAGCRDPNSSDPGARVHDEPRLWLSGGGCTELRWTFMGSGRFYDLLRGELAAVSDAANDLGLTGASCIADDNSSVRWSCDGDTVPPGGYFYLVRVDGASDYGRTSALESRQASGVCP